ncbi:MULTISPECIES: hypothetical protein [Stenotrophomonas]|jgi:hypothetical protein|uniref:hypothetical protein n=1 Tax=Stenotrophomonas TaxID=40323 RepID=UPI000B75A53F|nr:MULTISPECIES: hypothetical protein [Stenotrophomonas]SMR70457.1 hypothetical protein SAMN04487863_1200 [Stenotrophomonas sp. yr243]SNT51873.1 hypothetical protein SAMN05518671_2711 [Stenotrophomonas lactitubi]
MPRTHDGCDVESSSADWRLDCEARHLLRLDGYPYVDAHGCWTRIGPRRHRQQYLQRVQVARGHAERDRLAAAALRIWHATASHAETEM